MPTDLLSGLMVLSFESRRAEEIRHMIAGYGGTAISAPSMREVPLAESPEILAFLDSLVAAEIDIAVFLTGVGTEALIDVLAPRCPPQRLCELLRRPTVVARGPKPRAALRALGREPDHTVPEPNTWRELVALLEGIADLAGARVAIQEYGRTNDDLLVELRERGAIVSSVPVYRWALPVDLGPLRDGVRALARGEIDVVLFTSAQQCAHVLQIATELGIEAALRETVQRVAIASIGPICSEALRAAGLPVDIEPTKPKMGPLVRQVASEARAIVTAKRGRAPC